MPWGLHFTALLLNYQLLHAFCPLFSHVLRAWLIDSSTAEHSRAAAPWHFDQVSLCIHCYTAYIYLVFVCMCKHVCTWVFVYACHSICVVVGGDLDRVSALMSQLVRDRVSFLTGWPTSFLVSPLPSCRRSTRTVCVFNCIQFWWFQLTKFWRVATLSPTVAAPSYGL